MSAILLTPPAAEPWTVAEAKSFLRVEHDDDDAIIASLISAARNHVEALTRRALITQTWRVALDHWPDDGRIKLRMGPLRAVSAARVYDSADIASTIDIERNAALLSAINVADGGSGDARLQISKESSAKTASVFFSDAFSGRAEFGLVGSDAFKLKVSPDGSSWADALSIDQSSGNLALPRGVALSGVIAPPQITANQNDYNPAGFVSAAVMQLSSDAARNLSGLASGVDGRIVSIINAGTQPITLVNESASSTAANRFTLGTDLILPAKQAAILRYDATTSRWQAISGAMGLLTAANNLSELASKPTARANLGVRDVLAASRTYYVRTDGNDGNDGLANSAGGAFLTIQKAIDIVAALDISIFNVTIQVADGTYTGAGLVNGPWIGSGVVTLQGNLSTPANVLLSTGANRAITVQNNGTLTVQGFKLTNTTGTSLLYGNTGGFISFGTMTFGTCGAQQIRTSDGGRITASGDYTIDGGALNHAISVAGGIIRIQGRTITLTGTLAFAGGFAAPTIAGVVLISGNTFVGSATGPRYSAAGNAVVYTAGASITALPGDAAGVLATGGQYL